MGRLRVRGLSALSFCVFLKVTSINIMRASALIIGENGVEALSEVMISGLLGFISVIKTKFIQLWYESRSLRHLIYENRPISVLYAS